MSDPGQLRPVIIGGGPAGLTAGYELLRHGVSSTILEASPQRVGGLSQTVVYKGFRFDIGGHRFFSKNPEVEKLWSEWLGDDMLSVPRLSRILYNGNFFDYPLKASNAFRNLGLIETARCCFSWLWAQIRPRKPEDSFEDWVINRFGYRLYSIFFRSYTEKVWGIPCQEISADWAAQRIKDLNLLKAGLNALGLSTGSGETIKTLIDKFRYPRLGPGMLWESVSDQLQEGGCRVHLGEKVKRIEWGAEGVTQVHTDSRTERGNAFFSSMPMRSLIRALDPAPPAEVVEAAEGLKYRDYLTVILILKTESLFPDNWLYIHDPNVKIGRIQNYKNWSPEMVPEPGLTSLGLEYFCDVGDELWRLSDSELVELGASELAQLALAPMDLLQDGTVVRVPKAYPVYDDNYVRCVQVVREFVETQLPNLQMIGRNGMHRYNNQDHAMWTGILGARNALGQGNYDLWQVNADAEYLEAESQPVSEGRLVPTRL